MDYSDQSIMVSAWLAKVLPFVLLAVLGFNLIQMLFKSGWNSKRFATFYMTCVVGALCVVSILFAKYGINDFFLIPVWIAAIAVVVIKRKDFFPFALRCTSCGKMLSLKRILFLEPSLCAACELDQAQRKADIT